MSELFSQLGINAKLLLAQIINFLIIFGVLGWFVFPKLLKFLEQRKQRIQEGLEMREKAGQELERTVAARKREIDTAKQEADTIVQKAKVNAQTAEKETLNQARSQADMLLEKAKQDAAKEKQEALIAAREEMARTAVDLAGKVLSREISEKDEERMAKEVLEEVKKLQRA